MNKKYILKFLIWFIGALIITLVPYIIIGWLTDWYIITNGVLLMVKWFIGIILTLAFLLLLEWIIDKIKTIFKYVKNKLRRPDQRKS